MQDVGLCKQGIGQEYYLSLSDAYYRVIVGYDIPDTHAKLVNLNLEERKKYREDLLNEYKYRARMYIYEAMKKV